MYKTTLLLATALLALGTSLPARADDAPPPPHGTRHEMPRDLPPPPLAILLEDALPALRLSDAQQSLWLKAEQYDLNQQASQPASSVACNTPVSGCRKSWPIPA